MCAMLFAAGEVATAAAQPVLKSGPPASVSEARTSTSEPRALTSEPRALTSEQQAVFGAVMAEEFCGCGSPLTIATCLRERPGCELAEDLAGIVARAAASDVTSDELLAYLSRYVMRPFCDKPVDLRPDGAPAKGPAKASVTLIELADFRCGHCRAVAPILRELAAKNPDVRFVFMPFPLNDHPLSVAAAEAALAAAAQGKFWEMHDALFENTADFDREALRGIAQRVGLNVTRFDAAMESHEYRGAVEAFKRQGIDAGLEGTPMIFINGREYEIDDVLFTFDVRLDMERHRNGNCK